MICKKCGKPMRKVMRFSVNGSYSFNRCDTCKYETEHVKLLLEWATSKAETLGMHLRDCKK